MASPTVLSITCTATTIDVVFNQTLLAPTGRPGEGFSFTADGLARVADSAQLVTTTLASDTVRLLSLGVISSSEVIKVTYNNAANNLQNAGLETPVSFLNTVATNSSLHAKLFTSVLAQQVTDLASITLTWSLAVTSANFLTGLTVKANGILIPLVAAVEGANPRTTYLTLAQPLQYNDLVTFSYDATMGNWTSGYAIQSLSDIPVVNASKLGTPSADFPLSSVTQNQIIARQGVLRAQIGLTLNPIDVQLLAQFGPVVVDFGGTFGVTTGNPAGIQVLQDLETLRDGLSIWADFEIGGSAVNAAAAAQDWLGQAKSKVAIALAGVRSTSQGISLGSVKVGLV